MTYRVKNEPLPKEHVSSSIVSFSEKSGVKLLATEQDIDFEEWCSVQVGKNLIFQSSRDFTKCRMLRRDENNAFSSRKIRTINCLLHTCISKPLSAKQRKSKIAKGLYRAGVCQVFEKFIYVTGGSCFNTLANCHRYDIDRNLWQAMQ